MQTLRIFISSPGDVADERQIAGKVIERLQGKYWSFVRLDDVFWEQKVIRSTAHYQDELVNPGDCEMVIGILWSRLGSLMPEKFRKASGERYDSGTEWELEMAFEAYEQSLARTGDPVAAKPDIVIYRRNQLPPQCTDPEQEAQATAQITRLDAYFRENFWFPDGTIKRPITNYATLDEFEAILSRNLEELILRQIPGLKPGFEPPPISGSPFKGLQAFDFADSDRYFGRNREIREIQQRLIANAANGLPFLLIYGGSGYGKSSLMRAGLGPVLTRPGGSLDGIQGWRRVSFQPAKGRGSLCERLGRSLIQAPSPEEAEHSRQHRHWPLTGLPELADSRAESTPWDSAMLSRHFSDDDHRGGAIAAVADTLVSLNRHLLLEIDQLEEMFTVPGIEAGQRAAFLRTIGDLCLSGRVWVVATMRSEFFPRVAEQPELFGLVGKERGYILPPPDRQSLREIIRYPVLAARLDFERRIQEIEIAGEKAKHDFLHDQILADAESSPDALPLLEFTLQQLYEEKRDTLLTWDAYAKAGGLKGAIAQRATQVYQTLGPVAQEARHRIFAALVHIDPTRGTVTRQRAPLDSLKTAPGSKQFLDAFLDNHLLVTDEDGQTGQAIVTLAHEALISHWDELSTWIQDHQGDLLARQRLREQSNLWLQNGRKKTYLLSEARLAEAQRVSVRDLFTLTSEEEDFLKLSQQRSRKKLRFLQVSVAVFAIVALVAVVLGAVARQKMIVADMASAESLRQKQIAEAAQERSKEQLREASQVSVGVALDHMEKNKDAGIVLAHLMKALDYSAENQSAQIQALNILLQSGHRFPRLPMVSLRHEEAVASAHFSPNGLLLVTASSDPENSEYCTRIWEVSTGKLVGEPLRHNGTVVSAVFSPDSRMVVTASKDNTAQVWDAATAKPLSEPLNHEDDVTSAAFSADGRWVVTASKDDTARIWDSVTGKPIGESLQHKEDINYAVFSADNRMVATASRDSTVQIWDTVSFKAIGEPLHHSRGIIRVAFSPDGQQAVTASADCSARIWDVETGKPIGEIMRHEGSVLSAEFSPDGRWVVTASEDKTARVWEAATGKPVGDPLLHEAEVVTATFSADGCRVVTASLDSTARLWNAATSMPIGEPLCHEDEVTGAAFSADGRWVVTASKDQTVKIWNSATGKSRPLNFGSLAVSTDLSRNSRWLVTASSDKTARVWDAATAKQVGDTMPHERGIQHVSFSEDGRRVVTVDGYPGGGGKIAQIWDTATGRPVGEQIQHAASVESAIFSPDGRWLLTTSYDSYARVWDATTGTLVTDPLPHIGDADRRVKASFSSNSRWIITASSRQSAQIWEAATGKAVGESLKIDRPLVSAAFSTDCRFVVTRSRDDTDQIWDAESGNPVIDPLRLKGLVEAEFKSDNTRADTRPWQDKTVRAWESATGLLIGELSSNTMFSEDGRWLFFHRFDERPRRFELATGATLTTSFQARFAQFVVALGGVEINSDGSQRSLSMDERLRQGALWKQNMQFAPHLSAVEGESIGSSLDDWSRILDWFFSDPTRRAISPSSSVTVPEYIEHEIEWVSAHPNKDAAALLQIAYECDPSHPLIHLGMAVIEKDEARKSFLINYGARHLPEDVPILTKGVILLRRLESPKHALWVAERILKSQPKSEKALEIKAWALTKLKNP